VSVGRPWWRARRERRVRKGSDGGGKHHHTTMPELGRKDEVEMAACKAGVSS